MAKQRNKNLASKMRSKPEAKANPFESHVNKVKHNVLGRRAGRGEVGKPSESRHKAFAKRKATLLPEYLKKDKSGKGLVDRRIGEKEGGFAARKAKIWQMKAEMDQELVLTHKGKTLDTVSAHERAYDSDDEEVNLLSRADFIESTHFGGGEDGKARSQKEFLDEMHEEKRKRQLEREADIELTERLDTDWLSVRNLIRHKGVQQDEMSLKKDDYDMRVRELMFANKSTESKSGPAPGASNKKAKDVNPANRGPLFEEKLAVLLETTEAEEMEGMLRSFLSEMNSMTLKAAEKLKHLISEVDPKELSMRSFALLVIGSCVYQLKLCVKLKLIDALLNSKLDSFREKGKALLVSQLLLKVAENRYIPEVVRILQNMLVLFSDPQNHSKLFIPQIKLISYSPDYIELNTEAEVKEVNLKFVFGSDEEMYSEPEMGISLFNTLLTLIKKSAKSYREMPAFTEAFSSIKLMIDDMVPSLPANAADLTREVVQIVMSCDLKKPLSEGKKKPFIMPMFEPKLDDRHCAVRDPKKKLVRQYKREFKGAQRELRKDSSFMRQTWINETSRKDQDRRRKVKELMSDLASEQRMFKKKRR